MVNVPGTVAFPTALDDAISLLGGAANRWSTQLGATLGSSDVTMTVNATTGAPSSGVLTIDNERIAYTSKTSTTFAGLIRGFDGSSAASHGVGAAVESRMTAKHHNVLVDAVIALETKVGIGSGGGAQLTPAPGTASAPAYAFSGRTNIGMDSASSTTLNWTIGGSRYHMRLAVRTGTPSTKYAALILGANQDGSLGNIYDVMIDPESKPYMRAVHMRDIDNPAQLLAFMWRSNGGPGATNSIYDAANKSVGKVYAGDVANQTGHKARVFHLQCGYAVQDAGGTGSPDERLAGRLEFDSDPTRDPSLTNFSGCWIFTVTPPNAGSGGQPGNAVLIDPYGSVGVGYGGQDLSYKFMVSGDIYCTGSYLPSDERNKTNVQPLEGQLERLRGVRAVSYQWAPGKDPRDRDVAVDPIAGHGNPTHPRPRQDLGVLAQDLELRYPDLVTSRPIRGGAPDERAVNYVGLVAPLLAAVQELAAIVDEHEAEIGRLRAGLREEEGVLV